MNFDDQAVSAGCGGSQRHGRHQLGLTGGMTGIHHHGKVRKLVEDGYGGQIQGVAGAGLKGVVATSQMVQVSL